MAEVSVITRFDVPMFTFGDGFSAAFSPLAILHRAKATLHSGSIKAKPFGCALRPQP